VSANQVFRVEGVISRVLQPGVCRVSLRNGHCLVGYAVARERAKMSGARAGDQVELELSPCDLSKGRIRHWKAIES
jgi:translation initiation factor IF-1